MRKIDKLGWKPMWVSHLGSLKGCLEYLGSDMTDAWLFGSTGHAFIMNIHKTVCPSGPTAWRKHEFSNLVGNLGIVTDGIFSHKSMKDFDKVQEKTFNKIRQSIDNSIPCFGWELDLPEYSVINGYDENGYFFSGPRSKPDNDYTSYKQLGQTEIGILEVYFVQRAAPMSDKDIIKAAFKFATDFKASPAAWLFDDYKAGLEAYNLWINALNKNTADGFGVTYNASVWAECRGFARDFMGEAKDRLGGEFGQLFDDGKEFYGEVAEYLESFEKVFPYPPVEEHIKDKDNRLKGIELLQKAQAAEGKALDVVEKILGKLD